MIDNFSFNSEISNLKKCMNLIGFAELGFYYFDFIKKFISSLTFKDIVFSSGF